MEKNLSYEDQELSTASTENLAADEASDRVAGLLPCPFCGADAKGVTNPSYLVHYKGCWVIALHHDDPQVWNTRADSQEWQPIETAPINESVLIYIPNAEHYGDGIYRAIWIESEYEPHPRHWQTTGLHHGRDLNWLNYQPTRWMRLPASPKTQDANTRVSRGTT